MLMEADLPNDVEALRALVLEQSRTLATERAARADLALAKGEADAEIERLQSLNCQFAQGFGILTKEQQAAFLWTYEREFKDADLKAEAPFDTISPYPHRAILALVNWPFGTPAKNPAEVLPKAVQDSKYGFYMFRNRWQDAIERGFARASKTLRNITGLQVLEEKARVEDGRITEYLVTMQIIFVLEEPRA